MKRILLIAAALVALTACGSHSTPAVSPASLTAATSAAASSDKPMSFYAAQYTRMTKDFIKAQDALRALPDTTTNDVLAAKAKAFSKLGLTTNAALLRAQWPPKVAADIRAMVTADGPVLADFNDIIANQDQVGRDAGVANAASNILRSDLGLEPVQ